MISIYGLRDEHGNVIYVGVTRRSLDVRYREHLGNGLIKDYPHSTICLLENCPEEDWRRREKRWILFFDRRGLAKLNKQKSASGWLYGGSYLRQKKTIAERFWKKVDKSGGCWLWTASTNKKGYGQFGREKGGSSLAHRVAYQLLNGPIPKGLYVCHRCDNPPCVRPSHLFLGTQAENDKDKINKGRQGKGTRFSNAKMTEEGIGDILCLRQQGWTFDALARRFSISPRLVSGIVKGKKWKHVLAPRSPQNHRDKLTIADQAAICQAVIENKKSRKETARQYGVSMTTVRYIVMGLYGIRRKHRTKEVPGITQEAKEAICNMYIPRKETLSMLAKEYGISPQHVHKIVTNQRNTSPSNSPSAKLTFTQAEEIRRRYKKTPVTIWEIAKRYDLSTGYVSHIIRNFPIEQISKTRTDDPRPENAAPILNQGNTEMVALR